MDQGEADIGRGARPYRSLTHRRGRDKLRTWLVAGVGLVVAFSFPAAPAVAQAVPPDEAWRTIDTEHFRVSFPDRLDALGRRAAVIAESALDRLEASFIEGPETRVEILLTDHVDTSNGSASVAPHPRVVVFARPPVEGRALSFHDDWLDLVLVHELAHILHLDRAAGPAGVLRRLFGRVPSTWPFFPGSATPRWVVEGLATWYESSLTDSGRVRGSTFEMYLRTAALSGRLERIDQASGETDLWPAGERPYAWGSLFFAWLLDRHGEDGMGDFVEAVAGQWIPYRLDAAARDAFGVSFSDEWREWTDSVSTAARREAGRIAARSELAPVEILTSGGRQVRRPRVSPDGTRLAVARADGRSDSGLSITAWAPPDAPGPPERSGAGLGRVRTNGLAAFDWLPDGGLLVSQFEREGPWRLYGDLYRITPDGHAERLTEGARLDHPSAAPDGGWAAAIRTRAGATDLVRVDLGDGSLRVLAEGSSTEYWADPAVSPDGRWIAVARWNPGSVYQVVVVDALTGAIRMTVDDARGVATRPAWTPDGRTLLFTSDRSGIPNLYARSVEPDTGRRGDLRQVTDVVTGVGDPSVSPDGRWIHLSVYTADGWELGRVPLDEAGWRDPVQTAERGPGQGFRVADSQLDTLRVGPYRSARTLAPRYWEPVALPAVRSGGRDVLGPFVGAATGMSDVVGRHTLNAGVAASIDGGEIDGGLSYLWAGWGNPLLSVSVSQGWDAGGPFAVGDEGRTVFLRERERRASLGLTLLRARWRSNISLTGSAGILEESRSLVDGNLDPVRDLRLARPKSRLGDLRLSVSLSTARSHGLSISPERGIQLFVQGRSRTELSLVDSLSGVVGRDRGVDEVLGRARAYVSFGAWGPSDHVLALGASGGWATGPGADAFWYDVGGASGQVEPITGMGLFGGRGLFFPVRGYEDGDRSGSRAWSASLEWRFPLLWSHRGWGLLPIHVDRLHGAVFVDAGNAWGPDLPVPGFSGPRRDALTSVGTELSLDALAFFTVPLRLRFGLAQPLVGPDGLRFYVRLGPSF